MSLIGIPGTGIAASLSSADPLKATEPGATTGCGIVN
jgi:hypothetical protein